MLMIVCLLTVIVFSSTGARQISLWGEVATFNSTCSAWILQNKVTFPALKEFTVCFSLQLQRSELESELWTVFMYRHPVHPHAELGFGGRNQRLVVWLFGLEFRTKHAAPLKRDEWYDFCITWSKKKTTPALYMNGDKLEMESSDRELYTAYCKTERSRDPALSSSCCQLAPNGSLTLGASHTVVSGRIQILPVGRFRGKVSVFRIWSRERSRQEVTSLKCTEGGVVKWDKSQWDTQTCPSVKDPSLECEWSKYEVKLRFVIFRFDGKNNTELYTAREIAHRWLEEVLPSSVYLPQVSVYEDTLLRSHSDHLEEHRWAQASKRFRCLVHLNIIPPLDVAALQSEVHRLLNDIFHDPDAKLDLLAEAESIYVIAIDFTATTTTPSDSTTVSPTCATTTETTPATIAPIIPFTSSAATTPKLPSTTTAIIPATTPVPTTATTSSTTPATTVATTPATTAATTSSTTPATTVATTPATTAATTSSTTPATTVATIPATTAATTPATTPATSAATTPATTAATSTATTPATTRATTPATTTPGTTAAATTTATSATTPAGSPVPVTTSVEVAPTLITASTDSVVTAPALTSTTLLQTGPSVSVPVLYFEVQMNVSLTGVTDPEQAISYWLNSVLPNDTMAVLALQLDSKVTNPPVLSSEVKDHIVFPKFLQSLFSQRNYPVPIESCVFQVEVSMSDEEPLDIENHIKHLLEKPFNNNFTSIAADGILISRILFFKCTAEIRHTREGLFPWPETSGGRNSTLRCPKNRLYTATRHCKICMHTYWLPADTSSCPLVVEVIPDLDHVDVTKDNAEDVLDMIVDLLKNTSHLNFDDLDTVLNKVEDIINVTVMTPPLGQALLDVISDVLETNSNLLPFTNTILNITESLGDRLTGYNDSTILAAPSVGMSVVDVDPGDFRAMSFGVLSDRTGLKPEIFINTHPVNGTVAFISLPSVLQQNFPQSLENRTSPRIQFQFFGVPWLFKTETPEGLVLNTFVVSASVTNVSSPIKDLEEDVHITLNHLKPNYNKSDVQCVYWNFNLHDGQGGWDPSGCRKFNTCTNYTTCLCDHLTHFGVLLDVSRSPVNPADEYKLTIISYVGCGVSSLFLGITVLTYTAFEKLRRDYPSQILINLSLALLGLNLVFLVNSWFSSFGVYGLCVFVASALHYFLLASFTWMGLEAVNMYFALVKVFNVYVPSYILKFCALGWGIPLVVCVVLLIVDREAYGSHFDTETKGSLQPLDTSNDFCWIQDNVTFYVSVVGYAALVFLFNIAVFIVVLIQIRRMRYNSPAGIHSGLMKDLKGVASLTLLLGLTWTIGFFTWGPARIAMLFLFSTLNSLQGLFIFVFHCLMKENVRKQWRIHLCFGRFRLEDNSEWSASASYGHMTKPKPPVSQARLPSVRSVKSSSTESTSASSDSSQRESVSSSSKRPDLGLFVNGLVIPRAQCTSSGPTPRSRSSQNPTPGWTNRLLTQENT
ncbi:hypothetical protein WMY93_008656 [Mugilogobius chulae]|uniref:Adhesion G-protein coupled receptor G4 n=1 Tax=Mugilogobius chulae TaxID=88201 RepID=A0AAW0PHR1_9GOBI